VVVQPRFVYSTGKVGSKEPKKEELMFKQLILGAVAALGLATAANSEVVLLVDLTVPDQVTITATDGLSSGTVSELSSSTGVLLENFYSTLGPGVIETLVSGDLTSFLNPSDGSPNLFNSGSFGLNLWSFSTGGMDFQTGVQAFSGSATWTLDAQSYADMVAGNLTGDIYAPADTDDDIATATLIGQWQVIIPAPGAMALLGVAGLVGTRRRR
jgi:hypothetical protein